MRTALTRARGRGSRAAEAALRGDGEGVGQRGVEVPAVALGHVELAGDVGLGGAELARVPEQPAYGVGGVQHDERAVGAGRPRSRPRRAAAPAARRR